MGWVYAAQNGDEHKFKIGTCRGDRAALDRNWKTLARGNPNLRDYCELIECADPDKWETYLHNVLQRKNLALDSAKEWFAITLDALSAAFAEVRPLSQRYSAIAKDVEKFKRAKPDGTLKRPGNEQVDIYERLKAAREKLAFYQLENDLLELELKNAIGTALGIEGIATWDVRESVGFDLNRLKIERRDIYEEYVKPKSGRWLNLGPSKKKRPRQSPGAAVIDAQEAR